MLPQPVSLVDPFISQVTVVVVETVESVRVTTAVKVTC